MQVIFVKNRGRDLYNTTYVIDSKNILLMFINSYHVTNHTYLIGLYDSGKACIYDNNESKYLTKVLYKFPHFAILKWPSSY